MIQINPSSIFPIVRQLADPNDNGTYYVQATVYDALTNTLLNTVNLTSQGSQLFTGTFETPGDSSGMGRIIYIVTKVYTNSGYTIFSLNYEVENTVYLVQQRLSSGQLFGGTGEYDYTYSDRLTRKALEEVLPDLIRLIIAEELAKLSIPSQLEDGTLVQATSTALGRIPFDTFATAQDVDMKLGKLRQDHQTLIDQRHNEMKQNLEAHAEEIKRHVGEAIHNAALGLHTKVEKSALVRKQEYDDFTKQSKEDYGAFQEMLFDTMSNIMDDRMSNLSLGFMFPPGREKKPKKKMDFAKVKEMYRKGMKEEDIKKALEL